MALICHRQSTWLLASTNEQYLVTMQLSNKLMRIPILYTSMMLLDVVVYPTFLKSKLIKLLFT